MASSSVLHSLSIKAESLKQNCNIPNLSVPKTPFRCESCLRGKAHHLGHKKDAHGLRQSYAPGECLHTDLQGPYVRSGGGARYSQILLDMASKKIWVKHMKEKTGDRGI